MSQPEYKVGYEHADECFERSLALLEGCGSDLDLIVLPEYCDVPVACKSAEEYALCRGKFTERILRAAREAAQRCNAVVFVNASYKSDAGYRNTTYAIDRRGEIVGRYFKRHPAPGELKPASEGGMYGYDNDYSKNGPYVVEIDGVRYGFLTCYDFYFYEDFVELARKEVDIVIGCSHQRSDSHAALQIINRFLCYNVNAYLVRASVSLGLDSPVGGGSTVITPDGTVVFDMQSEIGKRTAEIDPKAKFFKPAGYKGAPSAHWQYVDKGRN